MDDALSAVAHRKLSFRRQKAATGLAACAAPYASVHIKLGKFIVGEISAPSRFGHDDWRVRLVVASEGGDNRRWTWVTLRKTFPKEAMARAFVAENEVAIRSLYTLATHGEDHGD